MNCYYSPEKPAIGICKSCGRGISMEYATDVGNGLACKDHCEERVKMLNLIADRNSAVIAVANKQLKGNMLLIVFTGLLLISTGGYMFFFVKRSELSVIILIISGAFFIVRGLLSYSRSARYPSD